VLPSSRLEDNIIDLTFEFVRYKVRVFLDINSRVGFNSSVQVISLSCKWSNDTFPEWRHAILIAYNCFFFIFYRDGHCQEHNVDEQAICAVGLARAKPGIFIEAIQYLLVLATPVEVRMIMISL
jgi:hypothetical protein